jgi:hypothetical protein
LAGPFTTDYLFVDVLSQTRISPLWTCCPSRRTNGTNRSTELTGTAAPADPYPER